MLHAVASLMRRWIAVSLALALLMPAAADAATARAATAIDVSQIAQLQQYPPQIVASPTRLNAGEGVDVKGIGFQPNETVSVYFLVGGTHVTATADAHGSFTAYHVIAPTTLSHGYHTIVATGMSSHRSAKFSVFIIVARAIGSLSISPSTVIRAGQSIGISGRGFQAGETVHVLVGTLQALDVKADGNGAFSNLQVTIPSTAGAGTITVTATGTASQRIGTITLAVLAPLLPDGSLIRDLSTGSIYLIWGGARHLIESADALTSLGFSSTDAVAMPDSAVIPLPAGSAMRQTLVDGLVFPLMPVDNEGGSLTLSAPSGTPGTTFTVAGSHFGRNEVVKIYFLGLAQPLARMDDGNGNFSATLAVPGIVPPNTVLRAVAVGQTSHVFAVEPFSVIGAPATATIVAEPQSVARQAGVVVNGSGFAPNEQVNLFLAQTAAATHVQTDQTGAFSGAHIAVPASLSLGWHTLMVYGGTSKRFAQRSVFIRAS
jgi:hypothetical protein